MKKKIIQQPDDRADDRQRSAAFDALRGGILRQHREVAATDPTSPRVKPTLARLRFCDEASS
jgi:hypothetical protein